MLLLSRWTLCFLYDPLPLPLPSPSFRHDLLTTVFVLCRRESCHGDTFTSSSACCTHTMPHDPLSIGCIQQQNKTKHNQKKRKKKKDKKKDKKEIQVTHGRYSRVKPFLFIFGTSLEEEEEENVFQSIERE